MINLTKKLRETDIQNKDIQDKVWVLPNLILIHALNQSTIIVGRLISDNILANIIWQIESKIDD